jgi:hypothetical protein
MGRLGRKHKAGTGRNRYRRHGIGGLNSYHGNGQGGQVLTDGILVPDGEIVTPPLSTEDIQISTAPVVLASTSTLPIHSIVSSISKKTHYLSPFLGSRNSITSSTLTSATLEMPRKEYCVFLASMAKHGSTSESLLPNLVATLHLDIVVVKIELNISLGSNITVSCSIVLIEMNIMS